MTKYRYEEFIWKEIREIVKTQPVVVLPVGTIEQHGPQLPLLTDACTASEIARLAVESIPGHALLMPTVFYAFNEGCTNLSHCLDRVARLCLLEAE